MQRGLILSCLFLIVLMGCSNNGTDTTREAQNNDTKTEILVSAAASLTDAMDEIKEEYEKEHSNTTLTFNFAGSGKLAQQIQQGAPVDIFISANENWMNVLIEEGYIEKANRMDITGNRLVVITTKPTSLEFATFDDIDKNELGQIAIGNPESVPAGKYTKTVLTKLGKWDDLKDAFVYAKDVRQVLTYVETGNTEIGFVYESDALSSDNVKIITYSDPDNHEQIIYPGAVLNDSEHKEQGRSFLKFLQSEVGQTILDKYGFTNE